MSVTWPHSRSLGFWNRVMDLSSQPWAARDLITSISPLQLLGRALNNSDYPHRCIDPSVSISIWSDDWVQTHTHTHKSHAKNRSPWSVYLGASTNQPNISAFLWTSRLSLCVRDRSAALTSSLQHNDLQIQTPGQQLQLATNNAAVFTRHVPAGIRQIRIQHLLTPVIHIKHCRLPSNHL